MKPSSKVLFVITLLLISIFPLNISNGCWDHGSQYVGYSILHPNISEGLIEKPIVFTYTYFGGYWTKNNYVEKKIDKNIIEWQNFFLGVPKPEDLSFIIYESKLEDLEKLKMLQFDADATIPDTMKNISFFKTFKQYNFFDFLEYLIFAKECEPHFTRYNYWKKEESQISAIPTLIKKGIENYHAVNNDFLKLRYGFQILRLTWYAEQDVELAYNDFIKPLSNIKSVIQNLATERLGGWLSRSKKEQKSIYGNVLLAKSLIGNLERSREVFLGFTIKDQMEWDKTITACENDEQRSLVQYLRALEKHSIALDDMKSIYKFHPKSKALEILMTREMQKIELRYLTRKVKSTKVRIDDSSTNYGIPEVSILNYIIQIKSFVKKIVAEKKCNNLSYWLMMNGYLEYMTHNHQVAKSIFSKAKKEVIKGTVLHDQIELLEFANLLSLKNTMDEDLEIQFGKIIKANKAFVKQYKNESDFFMEKMGSLYAQKGDFAKAYLCNYEVYGLKFYPNSKDAKAVLTLFDKPQKNDFEKYILEDENIKTREEILDILGTSYLGEGQTQKAIEIFATIPQFGKKFNNPFQVYIFEQNMKERYPNITEFSKYEIAQKIFELENEISQNPTASAEAHLALGAYEYHSSYFGYAWKIKDYYQSIISWKKNPDQYRQLGEWTKGDKTFMNLALARKHFKKVFELTEDRELQAKATLMLSQLEKINNQLKTVNDKNDKKHQSKYYLTRLENNYFETKFYEEYLKECTPYNGY